MAFGLLGLELVQCCSRGTSTTLRTPWFLGGDRRGLGSVLCVDAFAIDARGP